ncbi:MAG: DUF2269 family protein [Myxococcota bacterium]
MTPSGKATLVANVVAVACTASAIHGVPWDPVLPYAVHKTLHLVGVTVLMGNLSVGPAWLAYAWWRDPPSVPFAVRALVTMDLWLTAPAIVLITLNGLWLASAWGGPTGTPWLRDAIAALAVAWAVGPTFTLYWQERVAATAEAGGPAFTRALVWWSVWGTLAMVPMGAAFWWMISKPS